MTTQEVALTKDRDLLACVAVHSPHIAGTLLRLLNDLEDAVRLGELPPSPVLAALGGYLGCVGRLVVSLAGTESHARRQSLDDSSDTIPIR